MPGAWLRTDEDLLKFYRIICVIGLIAPRSQPNKKYPRTYSWQNKHTLTDTVARPYSGWKCGYLSGDPPASQQFGASFSHKDAMRKRCQLWHVSCFFFFFYICYQISKRNCFSKKHTYCEVRWLYLFFSDICLRAVEQEAWSWTDRRRDEQTERCTKRRQTKTVTKKTRQWRREKEKK